MAGAASSASAGRHRKAGRAGRQAPPRCGAPCCGKLVAAARCARRARHGREVERVPVLPPSDARSARAAAGFRVDEGGAQDVARLTISRSTSVRKALAFSLLRGVPRVREDVRGHGAGRSRPGRRRSAAYRRCRRDTAARRVVRHRELLRGHVPELGQRAMGAASEQRPDLALEPQHVLAQALAVDTAGGDLAAALRRRPTRANGWCRRRGRGRRAPAGSRTGGASVGGSARRAPAATPGRRSRRRPRPAAFRWRRTVAVRGVG